MGGFIIDDALSCGKCGRVASPDAIAVGWRCMGCGKRVCRYCVLMDPTKREILDPTLCSEECRKIFIVECIMKGIPVDDDVRRGVDS